MKFNFFHLMPYPTLPEDFDERFATPSLTYPNGQFDPQVGVEVYNRYLDELEYADELGYDGICVNEHHQSAYGMMPAPNIMAAALARRTKNAKVMVLGNAIGLHQYPLRVAEEIAMLDHLSRGRVVSGFVRGIGWEYFNHGVSPVHSRERFNEAHDLIIKAWTSPEPFEWWGKHYEFRYVNVWPRPLQDPHPDIYIPGAGSRETMKYCAEKRYTFMSVYAPTPVVKGWFDGYRAAAGELGYEPDPEKIAFAIPIYVAETHEQAHREAKAYVEFLFHKGLKQGLEIVLPPGYMSESSLRGMLSGGPRKSFGQMSYEDLVDAGMVIVGSPESVNEQIERLRAELGFGQIMGLMCIGDTPHDRVVRTMELFAREVMPNFRSAPVPA
jgi:alkanesulfonate monooxygenase SsuD/methylene tetrahydromethanopterin reductase-like flavin-dependent oxidoreductase (luciferase family)